MIRRVLIVFLVFVGIYIAYFALRSFGFYSQISKNGVNNTPAPVEKSTYNILLLGYGGEGHDGPYLTDSIMVAQVDLKKNKVALVSLPRDLWVKLPTKTKELFHSKINSIYQMGMYEWKNFPAVDVKKEGSPELMKAAIKTVTGLPIDIVFTVDFKGFEKAVDALGGIDVNVQKTFDDYEYPIEGKDKDLCERDEEFAQIEKYLKPRYDEEEMKRLFEEKPELKKFFDDITDNPKDAFPCRYEHLHFDAGVTRMDGATALKYVRSRHSLQDGTDFGRAARQQQFVQAVKNKLLSVNMVTKVFPLMDELQNHITIDVSPSDMKKFVAEAKDISAYTLTNIRLSTDDYLKESYSEYGGYILIPRIGEDNWKEIHTVISNSILGITPTVTPAPTKKVTSTGKK